MKRCFQITAVMALMLSCAIMLGARTQDEEAKPSLSMVVVERVKPSMVMQYEEATKELIALFNEHQVDPAQVAFHTVSGPELGYVYVLPLNDFADIDRIYAEQGSIVESIGVDRFQATAKKADACVESREVIHTRYREDLSYMPENPRLSQDEIGFVYYTFLFPIPGHEQEFEQVAKDFAALYAEKNIGDAWHTYQVVTGSDLPLYVIADFGKSQADFFATMEKNEAAIGMDAAAIMTEGMSHIRRMEHKEGMFRPDLSYPSTPATEDAGN